MESDKFKFSRNLSNVDILRSKNYCFFVLDLLLKTFLFLKGKKLLSDIFTNGTFENGLID